MLDLRMYFMATGLRSCERRPAWTVPKPPRPSNLPCWYSLKKSSVSFKADDRLFEHFLSWLPVDKLCMTFRHISAQYLHTETVVAISSSVIEIELTEFSSDKLNVCYHIITVTKCGKLRAAIATNPRWREESYFFQKHFFKNKFSTPFPLSFPVETVATSSVVLLANSVDDSLQRALLSTAYSSADRHPHMASSKPADSVRVAEKTR